MDGQPTVFDMNGLRGSNFVLRDRLTGSDWQQGDGIAFAGPKKGQRLDLIPFTITTWGEWRARHPQTQAFVVAPELREQYALMAGRQKDLMAFPLPARDPLREDARMKPTAMVAGVEIGGAVKAYPLTALGAHSALNDQVGSSPVVFFHHKATETNHAYVRVAAGRTLTFAPAPGDSQSYVDRETGSTWNRYGESVAGKLKGSRLEEVLLQPSFWFSWAQFHPDTQLFQPREQ